MEKPGGHSAVSAIWGRGQGPPADPGGGHSLSTGQSGETAACRSCGNKGSPPAMCRVLGLEAEVKVWTELAPPEAALLVPGALPQWASVPLCLDPLTRTPPDRTRAPATSFNLLPL